MPQTITPVELANCQITYGTVAELDSSGEPCDYCQTEGAVVALQFYGETLHADGWSTAESGECCPGCLPVALHAKNIDLSMPIHIETEAGTLPGRAALEPGHNDLDAPQYKVGHRIAHELIDAGEGAHAADWLAWCQFAAARSYALGFSGHYLMMQGLIHTLRDYLTDRT